MPDKLQISRILIVGVDWFGDVLLSTPFIRSIKKAYPNSYIAYSTSAKCVDLLKSNPYVDQVISYDENVFLLDLLKNIKFLGTIRKLNFDTAFFLHRSATRAFIAACAGIKNRIGFARPKNNAYLTQRIVISDYQDPKIKQRDELPVHRSLGYLKLIEPLGISSDDLFMDYKIVEEDRQSWDVLKKNVGWLDNKPYIVVHPGANWPLKKWSIDNFKTLIKSLVSKGYRVAICGTKSESDIGEALAFHANLKNEAISFCGTTSIRELAAMLDESSLVISNDSGPIHLAAALKKPLLGLFGPTSLDATRPHSTSKSIFLQNKVGCRIPCYFQECHYRVCMDMDSEIVLKNAESLLQSEN